MYYLSQIHSHIFTSVLHMFLGARRITRSNFCHKFPQRNRAVKMLSYIKTILKTEEKTNAHFRVDIYKS